MPKRRQPQRRRSSLIMTPLRRVILEEVTRLRTHPTADEIYQVVRRRMPRASLSSVYRNLNLMCDEGLIQRADIAQVHARFDGVTQPHYHVRCVRCGRMDDVETKPQSRVEEAARRVSSYEIIGHRLEFVGVCPECRGQQRDCAAGPKPLAGTMKRERR